MAERSVHIRIAVKDLEAARARLASLGIEGEEALSKIERGAPRAAAGLDQVDRSALRAGRNMRFALGNAAAQIQDVVVSLQAGQRPLTVLIQQGSQLASAFGPVGVILGTVGALLTAGISAWLGYRDATQDAGEEVERFEATQDALKSVLNDVTREIGDQADAIADLTGAARQFGIEALEQQRALATTNVERQATVLRETLQELENALLAPSANEIRPGVLETLDAIERAQQGGDLDALAASTARLAREMGDPAFQEFGQKLTEAGLAAEGSRREIAAVEQALEDIAAGTTRSTEERAAAEKAAADSIAADLKRTAREYEALAQTTTRFFAKLDQHQTREQQQAQREADKLTAEAKRESDRLAATAERERERLADQAARELQRPFDTAATNIQNTMTDVFENIYSGGVTSFEDIAAAVTQIFTRLAAELTTLMIIRPEIVLGGGGGVGGTTSLASQLSGTSGGLGALFGGGVTNPAAGTPTSAPVTGPGGMLVGGGVTSSAGAPAGFPGFTAAGALQGAGIGGTIGAVGGGLVSGGDPAITAGSTIGGIVGGAAGSAFGPAGMLIGSALGSLAGGLIGSVFGGGNDEATGSLRFSSIAGGAGPFGGFDIGGENAFRDPLKNILRQFDAGVAEFLSEREEDIVAAALQNLPEFDERLLESDPSKGFTEILRQRAQTVIETGFPGISAEAVLEGATSVEDIAGNLQTALQTLAQVQELTQAQGAGATLRRELEAIAESFDELRANAELYGIAIDGLTAAERRAIQAAKDAAKEPIRQQILQLTLGSTPAGALELEIARIEEEFDLLRKTAKQLGISTKGLTEAEERAIQAAIDHAAAIEDVAEQEDELRRQRLEQIKEEKQALALSIPAAFEALADPLQALMTQIRFENKNPAQQLEAARRDFERLVRQAEQGNLEAIAQLPGAAELFRSLAGQFGASPLQAQVDKQIFNALADVLGTVRDAQQEASRGMVGAINRASRAQIDTLQELIAEMRDVKREIKRLRQEARVA